MNAKLAIPNNLGGIVSEASRNMLVAILESGLPDWNDPDCSRGRILVACREELVRRYPCQDCGSEAGKECKPDFGCEDRSRRKSHQGMIPLVTVLGEKSPAIRGLDFSRYIAWERDVAEPALTDLGYDVVRWTDGERDSFGPLSRVVTAEKDGEVFRFVYG